MSLRSGRIGRHAAMSVSRREGEGKGSDEWQEKEWISPSFFWDD